MEKNKSFGKELFVLAKKHNIKLSIVNNIQDLLKVEFKDLLEGAMKLEFDNHVGYEKINLPIIVIEATYFQKEQKIFRI